MVRKYDKDVTSNYIAAAAAVGNVQSLRSALQDNPDQVWEKSPIFGYPLVIAAARRHSQVVGAIVKHFEHTQDRTHMGDHQDQFVLATSAAFGARDRGVALLLLQVLNTYSPHVETRFWEEWMSLAIVMRDSELIHRVRITRRLDVTNVSPEFRTACSEGDLDAVRMFIEEGFVPLRGARLPFRSTPIQTVVLSGKPNVVELVLKMGANPNGDWAGRHEERPLWEAILQNSESITQLLLRYGADPRLIREDWDAQEQSFRDARANLRDLMVSAEKKGDYYIFPTEPRTKFAINAPNLVVKDYADKIEGGEKNENTKADEKTDEDEDMDED